LAVSTSFCESPEGTSARVSSVGTWSPLFPLQVKSVRLAELEAEPQAEPDAEPLAEPDAEPDAEPLAEPEA
jgi:hypothetical protein